MIMNRRDFLKTVGRGASVAGVSPKSVGKMLMNVAGGAAAPSAPLSVATISQALKRLDTLTYNLADESFITTANQKVIASTLKSDLLKILPVFASKGIHFEMGEKGLQELDKVLKGEMNLADTVLHRTGEASEFYEYIPYSDALKNGLINQDFKNYYIDKHGEIYYADIHFDSLPESRLPWDEREKKWIEFLKKHYPETYKSEKAWYDETEKRMYDNIAKDINYSRMDTAGGAEDKGYAKYYEELKQFGALLENMNRRGFLKMLGKGAAAATGQSLVPKGVVGSVLKGALGGASAAAPFDLKGLLASYMFPILHVFPNKWNMNHDEVLQSIYKTKNIYTNIFNLLVKKNPQFEPYYKKEYKLMIDYLEDSRQVLLDPNHEYNLFTLKDSGKLDQLQNANTFLNHVYDDDFTPLITNHSYHYLMTPQMKEVFKNEYDLEPDDNTYITKEPFDPIEREERFKEMRKQEKEIERKYEYKNIAKDINYSRMDKAGGAEDTDYAKYYEKVKTFDQLLYVVKEADDDIISGDTEGIEPGETGMPRGFGHPDRNRNYDDTVKLNVIYGVPEDVDNAYNTATGKKLQQFVKQQLPWLNEYSPESNFFYPGITYYDIATELQRVYEYFKYWVETEDYDKENSYHVERKEHAMYFLKQYPGALNNFSRVFKYEEFLYGDSPSNPENINNYPLNVSLYDTTRELGGHEEGGWWYDIDRLVSSIPVSNLKQAEAAAKKLYNNMNNMNNMNLDGKPFIILEKQKGSLDTTNNPKPEYE